MFTKEELTQLFASFNRQKILVVGDIMLDSYIWGKVDRISPEAPVPIVSVEKRTNRLGGAANVALNINSLGAKAIICTVIGADQKGGELVDLLKKESMSTDGIVRSDERITTTKFRVMGNNVQLLRVDDESTDDLTISEEKQLVESVKQILDRERIEAIIFQDYNKGNLSKTVITEIIALAQQNKIPTAVDPKRKNFFEYRNVNLFKPNLKELNEGLGININSNDKENLEKACYELNDKINSDLIMITLSENGVYITGEMNGFSGPHAIPAHIRNVADVSGAGDTVISVAALCLAIKLHPEKIASLSNLAGGIVCEEVGVVPINKKVLLKEAITLMTK
ncbi:MAG: D-glycero-beta-D-manno-heptose-7-phosphate kinase [Bacteroidetes bacterium]|nr:D-glycero-beta-D-manno-heptose-7-phosphate kinase [Bacteroidota bacterium]